MKLFESEAKNILRKYGIATPEGNTASNSDEAEAIAKEIGKPVALKSQILTSGRGKSGGIIFANDTAEAKKVASNLIGKTIKGTIVRSLLVEEKLNIVEELYASVTIDRQARRYIVLTSTSGGIDIEQVTLASPDRISRYWVDPAVGFDKHTAETMLAQFPKINKRDATKFAAIIATLYNIAIDYDAELVEINPLARTASGKFIAADARITIDDNALFRHPEFADRSSLRVDDTPLEAEARQQKLAYVDLDGDIGIIGNGAGLVMATLDLVGFFGGKPANFLDMGGGAQTEVIKKGVTLVMSKPEVKAVLINILGGITRCDVVAQGIISALNESTIKKPIAVRMIGTNEEEGTQRLRQAGVHTYSNTEEAVKAVLGL
ncbi:MAG: ADP-forming succinate--CoA ligase subunit beta [Dehalococcoidales bacterium]|jgi:succinyl-CoA synthetase beta subunit|nr:ADP-forming succinate--CoA ligase subunit beta [Dehalococcoidales bacterium]|tara:strand:- start:4277 stop:5407 length:1131 start_codon:yes stop_codon:yes gene_type:complete